MDMSPLAARALAGMLEQSTGQRLVTGRQWRIDTALAPVMRAHGLGSLDTLASRATAPEAAALRAEVVEALLNHETSFFRDAAVFRTLGDEALPALAAARESKRRLRIWSAGCSTGQEAWSLALFFAARAANWADWLIEIVATDVSPAAIAKARGGVYSHFEVQRGLPVTELVSRFEAEGDAWRVRSAGPAQITFFVHNLLDPAPPGRFDMILCRNVLLYFPPERARAVLNRLAQAIAPDGLLVLGAGETVLGHSDAFQPDPALRGLYRRV